MDINDLRSIFTVLAMLLFIGIVWWAFSDQRKQTYEAAAMLPLDDDSELVPQGTQNIERKSS
jgi:cytochrome c oxidase cbb3-type subunit 4